MSARDRLAEASALMANVLAFATADVRLVDPPRRSGAIALVATEVLRVLAAILVPFLVTFAGVGIFLWCVVTSPAQRPDRPT